MAVSNISSHTIYFRGSRVNKCCIMNTCKPPRLSTLGGSSHIWFGLRTRVRHAEKPDLVILPCLAFSLGIVFPRNYGKNDTPAPNSLYWETLKKKLIMCNMEKLHQKRQTRLYTQFGTYQSGKHTIHSRKSFLSILPLFFNTTKYLLYF